MTLPHHIFVWCGSRHTCRTVSGAIVSHLPKLSATHFYPTLYMLRQPHPACLHFKMPDFLSLNDVENVCAAVYVVLI